MPWKAVLDALPGMVGYWDAQLHNVLANAAYLEYFDMTPEQIRGRHISEVLGPDVYAANLPYLTAALAGQRQDFDRQLTDRYGRLRHTQASYIPDVRDGRVHGVFVLVTDVTSRVVAERRLAEAAGRYRALASSMPDGFVLLFDADLRYLVAEGAALALFGYDRDKVEGRTLWETVPAELAEELEPRYRGALGGEKHSWRRRVGDRVFTLTSGPVVDDEGQISSGMVVALDTTEAHRAESLRAALHQLATAVARNAPWEQVVSDIAVHLKDLFGADTAAVVKFTGPDAAEIVAMAPEQPAALLREFMADGLSHSAAGEVARTGKPAIIDFTEHREGAAPAMQAVGLLAGASAPVRLGEHLWGAVSVGTRRADGFSEDVLDELSSFAQLVEIALGNLQVWGALTRRASTDDLTGLPNRAAFEAALAREARTEHEVHPYTVVLVDIDEFKQVNDGYGHLVGDAVVQEVAARLRGLGRGSDIVARYGGDEFVWLLPGSSGDDARVVAERARSAIADVPFDTVGQVTISLGLCASTDAPHPEAVLDCADQALYDAKRSGRNSVARHLAGR